MLKNHFNREIRGIKEIGKDIENYSKIKIIETLCSKYEGLEKVKRLKIRSIWAKDRSRF